jgi:hypothetical protein
VNSKFRASAVVMLARTSSRRPATASPYHPYGVNNLPDQPFPTPTTSTWPASRARSRRSTSSSRWRAALDDVEDGPLPRRVRLPDRPARQDARR